MDPADTTTDFAKAVAALVPTGADATKSDVRTTALSRLLDVIGAGAVPSDQQIAAAIQEMQSARARPPSPRLIHEHVRLCLGERLQMINRVYGGQPIQWIGAGVSGLVGRTKRDGQDRALKLMVASSENTFFSVIREQEIAAWVTDAYDGAAWVADAYNRVDKSALPTPRAYDWWRVATTFEHLTQVLGGEQQNAQSKAVKEKFTKNASDPLKLNEWMGLEMEYINADFTKIVLYASLAVLKDQDSDKNLISPEELDQAKKDAEKTLRNLLAMCLCVILQLESIGVTHNDLHEANVRVRQLPNPDNLSLVAYTLPRRQEPVLFQTSFVPAFSDFGRSFASDIALQHSPPDKSLRETFQLSDLNKMPDNPMSPSDKRRINEHVSLAVTNPGFDSFRLATAITKALIEQSRVARPLQKFSQETRNLLAGMTRLDPVHMKVYTQEIQDMKDISEKIRLGTVTVTDLDERTTYILLKPSVYIPGKIVVNDAGRVVSSPTGIDGILELIDANKHTPTVEEKKRVPDFTVPLPKRPR